MATSASALGQSLAQCEGIALVAAEAVEVLATVDQRTGACATRLPHLKDAAQQPSPNL